jgi:glycosyltransferase involved in cell wall biosynthesis
MRIGIDARELSGQVTGVGRILQGLLHEWGGARVMPHEFVLYTPAPLASAFDASRFRVRLASGSPGTWWEQGELPLAARGDRIDVFFAPAYTAPLRLTVPTVAAIYDLSYFAHPEWFRIREGARRRWLTARTAAKAAGIITASEFARTEIVERLGVSRDRIRVIHPGIDVMSRPAPQDGSARILFVGSIFDRRHVPALIRSVAALAHRHPSVSLDIVGDNRTYPHQDIERMIRRDVPDGHVRWHRYASREQLAELFAGARAFAFLSEYEGLGLTPLEAVAAGVPPVLYDTPVARESCGAAALYAPIGDAPATERALERAIFDERARASMLAAAPAVLARYDWTRAAEDALMMLTDAAGAW